MTRYLLNHRVYYDDEKCTLNDEHSADEAISLGATASRCLQILIEARGEVVAKKTLLHEAWEKFGAVVADGSMWQVISQLRKAFERVKLDSRLIINVPRIGYKVSQELHIGIAPPVYRHACVEHKEAIIVKPEPVSVLSTQVEEPLCGASGQAVSSGRKILWQGFFRIRYQHFYLLFILTNFLLAYITWRTASPMKALHAYQQHYYFSHHVGDIEVWLQNAYAEKKWVGKVDSAGLPAMPVLPEGATVKYIYINTLPEIAIISYFFCQKKITENENGCISSVYIDKMEHAG